MKTVTVTASPYATVYGSIKVPDNITENNVKEYVKEHFNEIKFGTPDLDYAGTEFDCEIEDNDE